MALIKTSLTTSLVTDVQRSDKRSLYGTTMAPPWQHHGTDMASLWHQYATIMAPWHCIWFSLSEIFHSGAENNKNTTYIIIITISLKH